MTSQTFVLTYAKVTSQGCCWVKPSGQRTLQKAATVYYR